ncbi:tRNA (guanosine(46)-N7)-methyltransferase TrmB [Coxiella endosymbiont of Ornithodoros maritimus]|uniref:tRNA (guanosine(46)-N7)-methyltransferase TrmB n=1 Tax=Coxiella endosymbiont of Ornithodoros maritimus TaxID=1656172 RepID=UPI002264ECE2|nr:tRNA (guanosine(46)-N7)-methyltransferase TrmB [Coxiella endosymbiont of Ornithodoros maritimus]
MNEKLIKKQSIRSFVRREGRLTTSQKRALETLWMKYGIIFTEKKIVFEEIFRNSFNVILEIGFGNGSSLLAMAKSHPNLNYLGVEIYRPGIASLLLGLKKEGITNLRICQEDVVSVLKYSIPEDSLAGIHIFFPDPWPKKRHHKRRLIQADFVALMVQKLKPGGKLYLATDWENYALQMINVLSHFDSLKNKAGPGQFLFQNEDRMTTKFERRGKRLGYRIWDLGFVRLSPESRGRGAG